MFGSAILLSGVGKVGASKPKLVTITGWKAQFSPYDGSDTHRSTEVKFFKDAAGSIEDPSGGLGDWYYTQPTLTSVQFNFCYNSDDVHCGGWAGPEGDTHTFRFRVRYIGSILGPTEWSEVCLMTLTS